MNNQYYLKPTLSTKPKKHYAFKSFDMPKLPILVHRNMMRRL